MSKYGSNEALLEKLLSYYKSHDKSDKDRVKVVRCEKCRYWHRYSSSSRKGRCNGLILYLNGEMETPEDFFCADGEER